MLDRCIAEPYAQSWSQGGMQIFQPQNPCSVTKGYAARNSAGSVDVTGKFSQEVVCAPDGSLSSAVVLINNFHGCSHHRATGSPTMAIVRRATRCGINHHRNHRALVGLISSCISSDHRGLRAGAPPR
jgi:hypothetical protein